MAEQQSSNSDNPASDSGPATPSAQGLDALDQSAIEELLKGANFEDAPPSEDLHSVAPAQGAGAPVADAEPMQLPNFQQVMRDAQVSSIDLLRDRKSTRLNS